MVRYLANLAGLAVITWLLPGISVPSGELVDQVLLLAGVALILTLVNLLARPVIKLLTLPIIVFTLGLFLFVINALVLLLTSWIAGQVGLSWQVASFWWALLGGLILSVVASITERVLTDDSKQRR